MLEPVPGGSSVVLTLEQLQKRVACLPRTPLFGDRERNFKLFQIVRAHVETGFARSSSGVADLFLNRAG